MSLQNTYPAESSSKQNRSATSTRRSSASIRRLMSQTQQQSCPTVRPEAIRAFPAAQDSVPIVNDQDPLYSAAQYATLCDAIPESHISIVERSLNSDESNSLEAAPRLSMSSVESREGSEIKTPESTNPEVIWNGKSADADTPSNTTSLIGASPFDETYVDSNDATLASRSATIKVKRPDSLSKITSHSYRTERTITPCESSSRQVSPVSARDVGISKITGLEILSDVKSSHDASSTLSPQGSVASLDSWRSLLPEHDPYFIPPDTDASRRWSNDSRQSSSSSANQVPISNRNAINSLYDLDGSFNVESSRAAFAPLQFTYNQSSRSLTSPRPSTFTSRELESFARAHNLSSLEQKRHASFSTFDKSAGNREELYFGGPSIAQNRRDTTSSLVSRIASPGADGTSSIDQDHQRKRDGWPSSSRSSVQSSKDIANVVEAISSPPNVVSTSTMESVQVDKVGSVLSKKSTTTTTTVSHHAHTPYHIGPLSTTSMPFLEANPVQPNAEVDIETQTTHYTVLSKLSGFPIDGITVATKHNHQLVVVADKWNEANGGHFERKITFGADADLGQIKANFDGNVLKIVIPRRTNQIKDLTDTLTYPTAAFASTSL